MRELPLSLVLCSLIAVASAAGAQSLKPGLWEMTTTTTMQQSPFPAGSPFASSMANKPQTMMVCLTQEQIDEFNGLAPQNRSRSCKLANIVKKPHGMTADMVCTGSALSGKGSIDTNYTDAGHATSTIHFLGSVQSGASPMPLEWTANTTSVFKGSDCGDVKPVGTMGEKQ